MRSKSTDLSTIQHCFSTRYNIVVYEFQHLLHLATGHTSIIRRRPPVHFSSTPLDTTKVRSGVMFVVGAPS